MKILFSILLLCLTVSVFSQTKDDILKADKLTWYGIDFSKVKMYPSGEFRDKEKIRDEYFSAINDVILAEKKKFNLPEFFQKKDVDNDLSIIKERNLTVKLEDMVTDNESEVLHLSADKINEIVKEYPAAKEQGIGVVFIMESMDKSEKAATMYITFFDKTTKKVIHTQKMTGKAGGFGFRNYWVSPVFKVLKEMEDVIADLKS